MNWESRTRRRNPSRARKDKLRMNSVCLDWADLSYSDVFSEKERASEFRATMVGKVHHYLDLDGVRTEPRCLSLLKRLGLNQQTILTRIVCAHLGTVSQ